MAQNSTGNTGTRDATYNLVSILYHALQGAETYDQYISDAEQNNDKDLAQFFRDTKEETSGAQIEPSNCLHSGWVRGKAGLN